MLAVDPTVLAFPATRLCIVLWLPFPSELLSQSPDLTLYLVLITVPVAVDEVLIVLIERKNAVAMFPLPSIRKTRPAVLSGFLLNASVMHPLPFPGVMSVYVMM